MKMVVSSLSAEASDSLQKIRLNSHDFPHCGNSINILIKNEPYLRYDDNSILKWIPTAKRFGTTNKDIYKLLSPRGFTFNGIEYYEISDSKIRSYDGDKIVFTKNGDLSQVVIRLSPDKTAIFLIEFECMMRSGVDVGMLILKLHS